VNNGKIVNSGNTRTNNTNTTNVTQNNSTTINNTNVDPQVTINPPVIIENPQPPVIVVAGGSVDGNDPGGPIDLGPVDNGPIDIAPIDNGPVDGGVLVDNGNPGGDANVSTAPTLNVFVYTLYYTDENGQQQTYNQYYATVASDGNVISWGGLVEAEQDLTVKGYKNWPSAGQFVPPTDAAAMAALQNSTPATDTPSVPSDVVGPGAAPQDATPAGDSPSSAT